MATPAPSRYSIAKPTDNSKPNGVLPAVTTTSKPRTANPAVTTTKAAAPRLKVVVRRLPPGLTAAEFEAALEDDWKLGGERIDWAYYKPGKISKDPAKPSRPSRAYFHLTKQEYLGALSDKVRDTAFVDAKGSGSDPALLGPPSVEFAPYGRVPNPKPRKDARQGTIDQDPEFIDFLESLTNPVSKPAVGEGSDKENKGPDTPTVTPLIQYLRDKKANKIKEATAAKASKHSRQDSKDSKNSQPGDKRIITKGSKEAAAVDKRSASALKVEKIARDAAKTSTKQANASQKQAQSAATTPAASAAAQALSAPTPEKKRERGNVSAAAKILQRDLGIGGSAGGRRRREAAATTASSSSSAKQGSPAAPQPVAVAAAATTTNTTTASSPLATTAPPATSSGATKTTVPATQASNQAPTGPAASRPSSKANAPSTNSQRQQAPSTPAKAAAPPSATSTQAFLKHANPSQGITEPLLEQTFAEFGTVTKVEIDKKKGFAYIDFSEPEGLKKAMAASPVKIAQGQVVVLERKTGPSLQTRNTRGGVASSGGRGGASATPRSGRSGSGRRGGAGKGGNAKASAGAAADTQGTSASNPSTTATTVPAAKAEAPSAAPAVAQSGAPPPPPA